MTQPEACSACLRRSWLLGRLAGHLDVVRRRLPALLDLADEDLVAAVAGRDRAGVGRELEVFDPEVSWTRCERAGVELICRCDPAYPAALRSLPAQPAVLHVAGGMARFLALAGRSSLAIVGARRSSPYGLETARSLARGGAAAGLTVVSGMAMGVDTAAHEGALAAGVGTVAVLACAPERPYPRAARSLHRRILATGAAVSELGVGVPARRWMFPVRNRIIAALSSMTVVTAARRGSGAMVTALVAAELGRELGAVPGQVAAPLSWGPHQLLRGGARLVADAGDVLDVLFGADRGGMDVGGVDAGGGVDVSSGGGRAAGVPGRPSPAPSLQPLVDAIADGYDPPQAFDEAGLDAERGLAALAELELAGRVRRGPGGRFSIVR